MGANRVALVTDIDVLGQSLLFQWNLKISNLRSRSTAFGRALPGWCRWQHGAAEHRRALLGDVARTHCGHVEPVQT